LSCRRLQAFGLVTDPAFGLLGGKPVRRARGRVSVDRIILRATGMEKLAARVQQSGHFAQ